MCAAIDTERRRVDDQIIMLEASPFVAGLEIVVRSAASVRLVDCINYAGRLEVGMALCHSRFSVVEVTVNE